MVPRRNHLLPTETMVADPTDRNIGQSLNLLRAVIAGHREARSNHRPVPATRRGEVTRESYANGDGAPTIQTRAVGLLWRRGSGSIVGAGLLDGRARLVQGPIRLRSNSGREV